MIFGTKNKREKFLNAFIKGMETEGRSLVFLNDAVMHKTWCINYSISQLRQYEKDILGITVMDAKQLKCFVEEVVDEYYLSCNLMGSYDIQYYLCKQIIIF